MSGRRSFAEPILRSITRRQKKETGAKDSFTTYNFYDLNAKLNWRISDKDRVFFSYSSAHNYFPNVSRAYYDYYVSVVKYLEIRDNAFAQPALIFNNIQDGLGNFSGYRVARSAWIATR
jgi:hypothetical protein